MHNAAVIWTVIGGVCALLSVLLPPVRRALGRLFKSQSLADIAQASATLEAAYQTMLSENKRLREEYELEIEKLTKENVELRSRVLTVEQLLTAKVEIEALTKLVRDNHAALMKKLGELAAAA